MNAYRKTIAAVIGSVLTWGLTAHMPDGSIDRGEWWGLAVAIATAVGVFAVPNGPTQVQVVNQPDEPVPVAEDLARVVEEGRNRPLRIDRGAVDVASAVLGFLVALALVVLIATLRNPY